MTVAAVGMWGTPIGAVSQASAGDTGVFQYTPEFARAAIEPAPLRMPLRPAPYSFPALGFESFRGLPGMLADSLPDDFGNAVIDAWCARHGRDPDSFSAVERLCYIGARGMGALEFQPSLGPATAVAEQLQVSALVELAQEILSERSGLDTSLANAHAAGGIEDILLVGSSAGGARPKAVIAYDPHTGAVRSGQLDAPQGFEHWIIKFDGIDAGREVGGSRGYGAIEYAYAKMAEAAGVQMAQSRLLEEGGRRHFMTRRFDRDGNRRLHMQSLAALVHADFRLAGAYSYEQALRVIRALDLSSAAIEEQFRRMVFNIVARNQDDHVKNIAFLMTPDGRWALSPGFDLTYAYNPSGRWTRQHQMSLAGKRDGFTVADLQSCARTASMARGAAVRILREVVDAVAGWRAIAADAGVPDDTAAAIAAQHRLRLAAE